MIVTRQAQAGSCRDLGDSVVARPAVQAVEGRQCHQQPPVAQRFQASGAPGPKTILEPLRADHERYVTTVSNPTMAASWEFVALRVRLLATGAFASVVDFGSGFTSYAIRYWCQRACAVLDMASVDDSEEWLQRSREFLVAAGTRADHLYLGQGSLAAANRRPTDLLVYDYTGLDQRARLLPQIFHFVHPARISLWLKPVDRSKRE